MDKGVIYARYSSHNQREESIEQQVAECRAFAEREGIDIVNVYEDRAVSGRSDKRTAFQRMLRDADARRFNVVIAYKSNRIARNMLTALQYEDRLDKLGIKTLYAREEFGNSAAGRFALRMMMNMNQFYSENMAEDIRRGMTDNAQNCRVNGSIAYGYRKAADGRYELDPETAPVAKEIFERIAGGEPYRSIADDLNARGLRTKYGNPWQISSFERMTRNPSYIGVYHSMGVQVPGGMPAIISDETWSKVQKIKDGILPQQSPTDYLLTGKLFCGECGSPMVGICGTSRNGSKHYYYSCNGHRGKTTGCSKKLERKDELEAAVVRLTQENILTDSFIEELADAVMEIQSQAIDTLHLQDYRKKRAQLVKRRDNILDALEQGIRTESTRERLEQLDTDIAEADERIRLAEAVKPVERERVVFTLLKLKDGSHTDRAYQRLLIKTFVRSVTVFDDRMKIDYDLPTGGGFYGVNPPPPYAPCKNLGAVVLFPDFISAVLTR